MMTEILKKLNDEMVLRGFANNTKLQYTRYTKEFLSYVNQPTHNLNARHIKQFLLYLIKQKKTKHSSVNVAISVLKFLFNTVLEKSLPESAFPFAKRTTSLPVILTPSEVERLLKAAINIKHRAILMTTYGCGLRISEVARLKIDNIDSERMLLLIENSKGNKSRYVVLPEKVLAILREYYQYCRPQEWLFPSCRQKSKTQHMTMRAINAIFYQTMRHANINKKGGLHMLRHSFATHLLDAGENIYTIKTLLGHTDIKTTLLYFRLTSSKIKDFVSPIDRINVG